MADYRRDVQRLLSAATQAGWTMTQSKGSGHYKLRGPNGEMLVLGSSPSCRRGMLNTRAQLRRAGVPV
jgi:predicted RNA binding protein YcfA (HicA-like mRNA interferase family)